MPRKVWTAADIERLSPDEHKALFRNSIIRDLDQVPPAFLARVRARITRRTTETEPTDLP